MHSLVAIAYIAEPSGNLHYISNELNGFPMHYCGLNKFMEQALIYGSMENYSTWLET